MMFQKFRKDISADVKVDVEQVISGGFILNNFLKVVPLKLKVKCIICKQFNSG